MKLTYNVLNVFDIYTYSYTHKYMYIPIYVCVYINTYFTYFTAKSICSFIKSGTGHHPHSP